MSDVEFTPVERVTAAYERLARQAKPYRRSPTGMADRAVVSIDTLRELQSAIVALPGDAFTDPEPSQEAPYNVEVYRRLLDSLGGFESAEEALKALTAGRDKLAEPKTRAVPPPIPRLPQGHDGIEAWEALAMIADLFDGIDDELERVLGVPRRRVVQADMRMWANELERRFR